MSQTSAVIINGSY